jgi:MFS family permease
MRHAAPLSPTQVGRTHALDPESARRTMFGVCQAGLVNNLNDGISWGVLPLLFAAHGLLVNDIGIIKAVYPLTWSIGQLATGALADRVGRRPLVIWGMIVQALGLGVIGAGMPSTYLSGIGGAILLGLGTAMVYPALLAAAAEISPAARRATTLGWYRFWRDLGYPAGALLAGVVSAQFGLVWAVYLAGVLTFTSGVVAAWSMTGATRQKEEVDDAESARMRVGAPRRA